MRACIVCGRPSDGSRCIAHRRPSKPWPSNRKSYGWAWQQLRKQVLAEEPNCRRCGQPSTQVDHIIPRAELGTDQRSNLQGLCYRCHRLKTNQEAIRGRRRAELRTLVP